MTKKAKDVVIGDTIRVGNWTVTVEEIRMDTLKNRTEVLRFGGLVKAPRRKPVRLKDCGRYFRLTTKIRLA